MCQPCKTLVAHKLVAVVVAFSISTIVILYFKSQCYNDFRVLAAVLLH